MQATGTGKTGHLCSLPCKVVNNSEYCLLSRTQKSCEMAVAKFHDLGYDATLYRSSNVQAAGSGMGSRKILVATTNSVTDLDDAAGESLKSPRVLFDEGHGEQNTLARFKLLSA